MIDSYPKVLSFGKPEVADILTGTVAIQEKVDGSQISFSRGPDGISIRSKGCDLIPGACDKMFDVACEQILKLGDSLRECYTYRGEYLKKPKHNALAYDRTPKNNIVVFDIQDELGRFYWPNEVADEAKRLGLEYVPTIIVSSPTKDDILGQMNKVSFLGGAKIEGVVVKNYLRSGPFGGPLMAKHVSEEFKEVHRVNWKSANPSTREFVVALGEQYRTSARWSKALQHLKERGDLTSSTKDIPALMEEVGLDILEEEGEEIREKLFNFAWGTIRREATRGLVEWFKGQLLEATAKGEAL